VPDHSLVLVLRESVDEILEKMFFLSGLDEPPGPAGGAQMVAHLTFEGNPSGWLTLRLPAAAARSVAADFLGEEEASLCGHQIGEVAGELANMICGSVLSGVESTTAFRLATPEVWTDVPPSDTFIPPHAVMYAAGIGHGDLVVIFQTETRACPPTEKSAF
jgi:chemotaxis protein CheY-P-specific phosphatase CheC